MIMEKSLELDHRDVTVAKGRSGDALKPGILNPFDNRASARGELLFVSDRNVSGAAMERQKEALAMSRPGQSTLASVEPARVHGRGNETHGINLLIGPLTALLLWLLVGGWLYFFGLPAR